GASLEEILCEAFAVVREASRRVVGMRHFDVQVIGAVVLYEGKIAEMQTGEGKTLVATMPAYLSALTGKGVHIVTVNDYLAKRDRFWMGPIFELLGLEVGLIQHESTPAERKKSYAADITYGTNNEYGFDYLRDNMAWRKENIVQRELHYAIVDEVDSILIDEARTPLIISGPAEDSTDIYYRVDKVVRKLVHSEDFDYEEKTRSIWLTENGVGKVERLLHVDNLYEGSGKNPAEQLVRQSLRAHHLYKIDVDYVVNNGEVIIVDEFTGRMMQGRRYSEGLHQAIEAKEKLQVANENQTLASITYQNYFRMYDKISGMTGTAKTEENEFIYTYGMPVVTIPPNKPLKRTNFSDAVYRNEKDKFNAVVQEIETLYREGRPVLVGTVSIEKSENLSRLLEKKAIPHAVLNAKNHEKEADIIKNAGQRTAVTISTNMAGRGTDIVLGIGVADLGGLHVVGTERHESRRIDNQLRGRSGRQGDPGSSRFFLSLEDNLLRLFGSERVGGIMDRFGVDEGIPIESSLVTRLIEGAQKKVEGYHFNIRKTLLQYDDVMGKQREVIYGQRRLVLFEKSLRSYIFGMLGELLTGILDTFASEKRYPEEWDWDGLNGHLMAVFGYELSVKGPERETFDREKLRDMLERLTRERYEERVKTIGEPVFQELERIVLLRIVDSHWKEHLHNMDHLREGIGLRAVGQRDPFVEYQLEAFDMFQDMIAQIREDALRYLLRVNVVTGPRPRPQPEDSRTPQLGTQPAKTQKTVPVPGSLEAHRKKKIGRNDRCPCGSGKKYKHCCGAS
ncbi:MAG TPA: preprotein translocase subunit SecA, partial [Atribacteraceae bacterium]|nr:preprotein translocase subunit SecA [Atribacteraceae bacterium]